MLVPCHAAATPPSCGLIWAVKATRALPADRSFWPTLVSRRAVRSGVSPSSMVTATKAAAPRSNTTTM